MDPNKRTPAPENTPPSHSPEGHKEAEKGAGVTRRIFLKIAGILGTGALADQISGGGGAGWALDKMSTTSEQEQYIQQESDRIAAKIEAENPDATQIEKVRKMIDYIGCLVFAWGLYDLSPWGRGHVASAQYGAMMALSALKHTAETPEGRHHLEEETVSSTKAFFIINGTIVLAEGLNLDLEKSYKHLKNEQPKESDRIALMTMTSSLLSPLATTVGSAGIIRRISNDFATNKDEKGNPKMVTDEKTGEAKLDVNEDMAAVFVSHVSNLSGFLLFGDPPFIAICEKYGFKEGVLWQMQTMWPLALYSLFSSTYKLNYLSLTRSGVAKGEAAKQAAKDAVSGLLRNIPLLARIMTKSLMNAAKYYSGADMKWAQDEYGINFSIGEVLTEKVKQFARLPLDPTLDLEIHNHGGMVHGDDPNIVGANDFAAGLMKQLFEEEGNGNAANSNSVASDSIGEPMPDGAPDAEAVFMHEMRNAMADRNYDRILELGKTHNLPHVEIFVKTLRDYHDDKKINESTVEDLQKESLWKKLNPFKIYDRSFSVDRIKAAAGHNMGDVINVFPFQAGCVPFLTTAFRDGLDLVDHPNPAVKEAALFVALMMFSSVADNYVACKIGLELMPQKPHTVLISSILGGSLSSIGNMANVTQFSLDKFPLVRSYMKFFWHLDNVAMGAAWAAGLNMFNKVGMLMPPEVAKGAQGSHGHSAVDKPETPENTRKMTRRGIMGIFGRGDDGDDNEKMAA